MESILPGIDQLCLQANSFKYKRVALVTNNAAATSGGKLSRTALLEAGIPIVRLFSPEHGLSAKGDDGAYQAHHIDSVTQLPVISLYGDRLLPSHEEMTGIDCVIYDIPDVGCRFYTYLWTMTYVMEACAAFNIPFMLADRPNPGGGDIKKSEGPWLDESHCASFIGRWNIPVRHCCSLGELAGFFAATRIKNLDLQVIKIQHWNRQQNAAAAGWNFVPTSPAIADLETVLLYPGMGMMEGINVNEGRGTEKAFKIMGAPWIDARQLSDAFAGLQLPGIVCATTEYTPAWSLYAGEPCYGLQFMVTDAQSFMPVKTGISLMQLVKGLYPSSCRERLYATVANPSGVAHLDKLTGVYQSFEKLGNNESELLNNTKIDWLTMIQPYLLY